MATDIMIYGQTNALAPQQKPQITRAEGTDFLMAITKIAEENLKESYQKDRRCAGELYRMPLSRHHLQDQPPTCILLTTVL